MRLSLVYATGSHRLVPATSAIKAVLTPSPHHTHPPTLRPHSSRWWLSELSRGHGRWARVAQPTCTQLGWCDLELQEDTETSSSSPGSYAWTTSHASRGSPLASGSTQPTKSSWFSTSSGRSSPAPCPPPSSLTSTLQDSIHGTCQVRTNNLLLVLERCACSHASSCLL